MSEWISVDNELPRKDKRVLALYRGECIVLEMLEEYPTYEETFYGAFFWDEPFHQMEIIEWFDVTHWMPLPEPPLNK